MHGRDVDVTVTADQAKSGGPRRPDRFRRTGAVAAVLLAVLAVVVPVGLFATHRDRIPPRPADTADTPAPVDERGTSAALAAGHWEDLPPAPIGGRTSPVTAWTGSQLLVWGGYGASTKTVFLPRLQDGASYDPATRTWQTLPPAPLTSSDGALSTWTGARWIVLAGREAASFDPVARRWQSLAGLPDGFTEPQQAVWTGREVIVRGYADSVGSVPLLRAYTPASNAWRDLPYPPMDAGRQPYVLAMGMQNEKLVTVSSTVDEQGSDLTTAVLSLDLASGTWTALPLSPGSDAGPRGAYELVASPEALYVPASSRPCLPVGAPCPAPRSVEPAYRFADGVWTALPTGQEDQLTNGTATVWTGSALVAVRNQARLQALDPAQSTWADLPPSLLPDASTAVWAGDQLFVLTSVTSPGGGYGLAGAALLPAPPTPSRNAQPFVTLPVNGVEPTACGTDAPLSVYTARPGAEKADTPEAVALRGILETGIAGMSFPPKHDWVELVRTENRVTYGARTGAVGIGSVVSVERKDGTWGFAGSGGCGPLGYGDARADYLRTYTEAGSELVLEWTGGTCGLGSNGADVRVQETPTEVRVVLVLRPEPPQEPGTSCGGVGTSETSRATLAAPVGDRRVVNVGYVPAQDVPSQAEYDAAIVAREVEGARAQAACDAAAASLGLRTDVVYGNDPDNPMTVGIVRGALADLPPGWADLPADTSAAQCYLASPPRDGQPATQLTSAVVTEGLPPYVYDRRHPVGGLFERLGDSPG